MMLNFYYQKKFGISQNLCALEKKRELLLSESIQRLKKEESMSNQPNNSDLMPKTLINLKCNIPNLGNLTPKCSRARLDLEVLLLTNRLKNIGSLMPNAVTNLLDYKSFSLNSVELLATKALKKTIKLEKGCLIQFKMIVMMSLLLVLK